LEEYISMTHNIEATIRRLPDLLRMQRSSPTTATNAPASVGRLNSIQLDRAVAIGEVFASVTSINAKCNVWGQGSPRDKTDNRILLPGQCISGEEINPAFYANFDIMQQRVEDYANKYNMEDSPEFNAVECSETDVNLSKLSPFK
jgi:hypothetical protein